MKHLIEALILVTMISCNQPAEIAANVVTNKYFNNESCICDFYYNNGYKFQDSCHLYYVLDTLPKRK